MASVSMLLRSPHEMRAIASKGVFSTASAATASSFARVSRRGFSAAAAAKAEKSSPSVSPNVLLGSAAQGSSSSSSTLNQCNLVMLRLKSPKQAPLSAIVEVVQQLGVITREAPPEERLELSESVHYRQLLAELLAKLPRDVGDRAGWDQAWTLPILQSLQELRLPEGMDRRLYTRLGNTVVQGAARLELEVMLRALSDICKLDPKGHGPDDFAIWSVGRKLEAMCQSIPLGELPISELSRLLHQFNHPAIRHRCSVHTSPAVVQHVDAGLASCTLQELPMLLLSYASDVELAPRLMQRLALQAAAPEAFQSLSMNEAAVVASALADQLNPSVAVAGALMSRIAQELETGLTLQSVDSVLRTSVLAAECLEDGQEECWKTLQKALQTVADFAFATEGEAQVALPAERLAAMLRWQLTLSKKSDSPAPSWVVEVAYSLAPAVSKLPLASLIPLVQTLAASETSLPGQLCQGIVGACETFAPTITTKDFVALALPLAQLGCLEPRFVEDFDIEAAISTETSAPMLAALLWALRAADLDTGVLWALAAMRLEFVRPSLSQLSDGDRALLFEAVAGHQATSGSLPGGAAGKISKDIQWKTCWQDLVAKTTPPQHQALLGELLQELGYEPTVGTYFADDLYEAPFVVKDRTSEIVVEAIAAPPRHPASQQQRGSVSIRHRTWMDQGKSVLAIPDRAWLTVAQKAQEESAEANTRQAQSDYLQSKLETLFRELILEEANPSEQTLALLKEFPIGGPQGLTLEIVKLFQEQNPAVQRNVAESFKQAYQEGNVRSPAGWVTTALQKQALNAKQREENTRPLHQGQAAKPKPSGGWGHEEGKPLTEAKPGLIVSGKVTNIVANRIWVNVGFQSDGTFAVPDPHSYQVGDELRSLKIHQADLEKGTLQLRLQPKSWRRSVDGKDSRNLHGQAAEARAKAKAKAKAKATPTQALSIAKARVEARSEEWKTGFSAARRKPQDGWKHKDAKPASEFAVGQVVSGKVTNVLHQRVWVNIGSQMDATFWMDKHSYAVDDEVADFTVDSIDPQAGRIVLKPPSP